MQAKKVPGKKIGVTKDMLPVLRIQASENCLIEFSQVDIRFNDCCGWQVVLDGERVLFDRREHERFQQLRAGVSAILASAEAGDKTMLAGAKALLNLLDQYPSFATLAAHPDRVSKA
ncbi:hypothetical protein SMY46_003869 [Cronobacter turicensis]|nr:hypothetical protein [Cronobacter turicensis]ELZ8935128.1 hypothetical protein [Cronobacter dublinensis]EMA8648563.1 hypothetical protein [Cronobacter turicensis]